MEAQRAAAEARRKAEAKAAEDKRVAEAKAAREKLIAESARNAKQAMDEITAANLLRYAKAHVNDRVRPFKVRKYLEEIVKDFPDTEAMKEAKQLLDELDK